jgi:hypothetical protein
MPGNPDGDQNTFPDTILAEDFHTYTKCINKRQQRLLLTNTWCFASALEKAVTVFHIPIYFCD